MGFRKQGNKEAIPAVDKSVVDREGDLFVQANWVPLYQKSLPDEGLDATDSEAPEPSLHTIINSIFRARECPYYGRVCILARDTYIVHDKV